MHHNTAHNAMYTAHHAHAGMGFLWGKYDVLESMQPWMGGGEMIQDVYLDHSTFAAPPARFEAGTPAIAEAIGLGAWILGLFSRWLLLLPGCCLRLRW